MYRKYRHTSQDLGTSSISNHLDDISIGSDSRAYEDNSHPVSLVKVEKFLAPKEDRRFDGF